MMDEGRRLVARAVVDSLRNPERTKAQAVLLYNAFAHRIDLGPALPRLQTTVRLERGEKARIEEVLDLEGGPLTDFKAIAGKGLDLSDGQVRHVRPWARGWRLMWVMLHASDAFLNDPMLLMGAKAIDAAAADGLRGGADELLHRLKFPWAQDALDAMLQLRVYDTPLLSNDDLHNVLRAMMGDEQLGRDTFYWMRQVDDLARRVALHAAAARALISLADDSSPCRFYPDRPANHVVGDMVRMFEFHVMRLLKIGGDVEAGMSKEAWLQISSKFPRSRTEAGSGVD